MYNIVNVVDNITNIVLVGIVVLIVMFGKNGQSRSNQLDINYIVIIALGLIGWLESDKWTRIMGLTGDYGQLIVEYGIVATLVAVTAVLLMDREKEKKSMERVGLIILATIGMIIIVSAEDLITVYLAMELQSLAFYTLAGYKRNEQYSAEAGLKYFILGALASGLYLLGVSILYGLTGLVNFTDLQMFISTSVTEAQYGGLIVGALAVIIALLFKIGVAPFHMWLPDVYQGAPTIITALFAIAPKLSILILLVRLYLGPFYGLFVELSVVFSICSLASMIIGAIAALNQSYIKRLLAYSAIAHVGYVLLALAVGSYTSFFSLLVYMVLYITTSITIFTLLLALTSRPETSGSTPSQREGVANSSSSQGLLAGSNNFLYLIGFTGLSRSNPVLAATLTLSLLSLAGIPPLSGFFGKWLVFSSAIHSQFYLLAIFGVLSSVISAFYYLRLIKLMYFQDSPFFHSTVLINALTPFAPLSLGYALILGVSLFVTVFFIFFPGPLYLMSHVAALGFML